MSRNPIIPKLKNAPREVKASAAFIVASLLSQGMAFITMPIFTRVMSAEQMGEVVTYTTWIGLIGSISGLGLSSGSFNVAMMKFDTRRDAYLLSVSLLSLISASVFLAAFLVMRQSISECLAISEPLVVLMAIMLMVNPILSLWLLRQRYEYRYKPTLVVAALNSIAGTTLAVALVLVAQAIQCSQLPEARLIGSATVTTLVSLVLLGLILRGGRSLQFAECIRYWKFAIISSVPLMAHSLGKYVLDASDRVMIGVYLDMGAVGIYGILYSISAVSLVVWNAINSSLIPYTFERLKVDKATGQVAHVAASLLGVYAVACIVLMLIAPEVVALLATDEYSQAVYLVPPIAAGIFFTSLYNLYSNLVLFREKTHLIMFATLFAAGANVVLNAFAIPIFGLVGAAYATLISYVILALLQFAFARRLGLSRVYSGKASMTYSVVVVGSSLLVNPLYSIAAVRWGLLVLIVAIGFAFRRRLMGVISEVKSA